MHTKIWIALFIFAVCFTVPAQTETGKPILLMRMDPRDEDVLNAISQLELKINARFHAQDAIAIRVCSKGPLTVALSIARGLPFMVVKKLEKLGVPASQIYYLRQSRGCLARPNDYASTEYWLIPKHIELPEFDEAAPASSLSGYQYTIADFLAKDVWSEVNQFEQLTPQSYQKIVDDVLEKLRQSRTSVLIIRSPYYRQSPTTNLKKRVSETLNYLKSNGIANHRVYVRRIYSGIRPPFHQAEPKYPDIFFVSQ